MDSPSARGPFGFRLQSSSPAAGCLLMMFAVIIGLAVALLAFVAALIMPVVLLIMRMVRSVLPKPTAVRVEHTDIEVIDVQATLLPPESGRQDRQ